MKKRPKQPAAVRIADLLKRHSAEDAARLTGYSLSAIYKFTQGKRTPPARSLPAMIEALGGEP